MPKYNIVCLGSTGGGKSTTINATANYVKYRNYDEALRGGPVALIPISFKISARGGRLGALKDVKVDGGDASNELHVKGQSTTQKPIVHSITYQGDVYNFIDTPGLCDTRGGEVDKENVKAILYKLSEFKEIHAILIMIDSTCKKFDYNFKFCISEFLVHFSRDALSNFFFLFTHKADESAEAFASLQELLEELRNENAMPPLELSDENCLQVDNIGFRWQCIYSKARDCYRETEVARAEWNEGRETMFAFFDRIKAKAPHHTENTFVCEDARDIIFLLLEPLATVTVLIATSESDCENVDTLIERFAENVDIDVDIDWVPLEKPQTVCTSERCIEVIKDPQTGKMHTIHKVCDANCHLSRVRIKTFPEVRLKDCKAMDTDFKCKKCGCMWNVHMHCDYLHVKVEHKGKISEILAQLRTANKQIALNSLKKYIEDLKKEQQKITNAMNVFNSYLVQNSVLRFNPYFAHRIEAEIRNEKVKQKPNQGLINQLTVVLNRTKKKNEMVQTLESSQTNYTNADVARAQKELFELPLLGEKIKHLYEKVKSKSNFDVKWRNA